MSVSSIKRISCETQRNNNSAQLIYYRASQEQDS
jgi:hypothetical protein